MAKVTEYPRITKMKDNDILLVDGPDGTRTILKSNAAKDLGEDIIAVTKSSGKDKVTLNLTESPIDLATENDLDEVADALLPIGTASGNPAVVTDAKIGTTFRDIKIGIEPMQSGSGDPSPSNVRPISGWTGANIYVSPTDNPTAGRTYSVEFPSEAGTVYGGTLDLTAGTLTVDRAYMSLTGAEGTWLTSGAYEKKYFGVFVGGEDDGVTGSGVCSHFSPITTDISISSAVGQRMYSSSAYHRSIFAFRPENVADMPLADFREWVADQAEAGTPLQISWKLTQTQVYAVNPEIITVLAGVNNVFADCGPVEVAYVKDVKIEEMIAEESDGTASRAFTAGEYVIVKDKLYKVTADISAGAELVPGTNVEETTVGDELNEIEEEAKEDVSEIGEDVSELKTQINNSTGNIEIEFSDYTLKQYIDTSGSTIPWNSETDTPITSTAGSNEHWAIVDCEEGDTFTISGRSGTADRLWAFADENKTILDPRAVISDRANELLLFAPKGAKYLIINDKDGKKSYRGELVKHDISNLKKSNENIVGYEKPYFNRKTYVIWVSSSEIWTYGAYANNAATPAGILYPLKTGDTIELTDYSGIVFSVYTTNGQEYKRYTNLTNKFTATENCNAAIMIQYNPGVALDDSNYNGLVNRVYIVHNVGIYNEINEAKADINSRIAAINAELLETKNLTIDSNFKSIAHRGYNYGYPENTEIAFIKAAQEGFKFVETDIRLTSDGIPVLLHDDTINRTARNADGTQISQTISIADITYQQALQYDFGIYAGAQFAGQKILSFDKFMGLCRDLGLQTLLEIKLPTVPAACQPIIDAYDMNDNVIYLGIISYIDYVYNQNPDAKYAMLVGTITDTIIAKIKEKRELGKNVIMDANYENITPELFEAVKSEKIPLIVFTINNDDTILNLDPYIGGVTSDYKNAGVIIYNHYMSLLP